jgi:PPOX class probable F420-dependent enzyme
VRVSTEQCWEWLSSSDHGVLCMVRDHGADGVPVCFAVVRTDTATVVATPVDRVKPKATTDLARVMNLARNPSAALVCEHWDPHDWSQLWWVKAQLVLRQADHIDEALLDASERALREKYRQYRDVAFAHVIVLDVTAVTGWSAAEETSTRLSRASGVGPQESAETDPLI